MPPKIQKPKLSKIEQLTQKNLNKSEDEEDDEQIIIKKAEVKTRDKELEFKRLTLHEQILLRPDTYIGSTKRIKSSDKVWVFDEDKFVYKYVTYPEGLLRIFMEPMSNVIDNIWRSKQFKIQPKIMKININRDNGMFEVWNDGKPISLDKFEENGILTDDYIIEVIFGQLLSSTNYNDSEERKTSGRNGYGSKLTNIFSKEFSVEAYNPTFKSIYRQTWKDNMKVKGNPKIEKANVTGDGKTGYTKISWIPDYKRFGMEGPDDDFMSVVERIIYNYSLIAFMNGVNTYYNDNNITIKKLEDYAAMHFDEEPSEIIHLASEDCDVVLTPRPSQEGKNDLMQVSFMNGIQTFEGGIHVDAWEEAIFRPIVNKINGVDEKKKKDDKKKKTKTKINNVDITHIRRHFMIFIVSEKDKPEFKSQEKTFFTGPPVTCNVKPSDINKLCKWSFMEKVQESIRLKQLMEFKEVGKKKRNFTRVENLDDANNAGRGKHSNECILCVTEGLSAATYVINGMAYGIEGKVGRDWIGVLPVTGKFLNVRNASTNSILDNKIIKSFIRAVGLEYGLDYMQQENRSKLRYGKLYMIADGDNDGCHITGLMINFIDTLFPSLLQSGEFLRFMRIPIIKIHTRSEQLSFLFQYSANKWIEEHNPNKNQVRYFKGLATSTDEDIREDFGRYPVGFVKTDECSDALHKVFHKDEADYRKEWILKYVPAIRDRKIPNYQLETITIADFLNEEMINFSIDDCKRSIPNVLDGLKESQRKVLFGAFKRNLTKQLKVAQFAAYVAEKSAYLHGETNLYATIISMAQRFTGSNNIPLFTNKGQFGSRLENGKDAGAGRYLFTQLENITRLIYRKDDESYLTDRIEESMIVEKEHYIPIIPMILVNGSQGIGTGSSCTVPSYNPLDLVKWIRKWIDSNRGKDVEFPILTPFWRGFKGTVELTDKSVITNGIIQQTGSNKYEITELPIGRLNTSISKFRDFTDELLENKFIKDRKNYCTDNDVHFKITVDSESMMIPTISNMKLKDSISLTNLTFFNREGKLVKYKNVYEIMNYFCEQRLQLYGIRIKGEINKLQDELKCVTNKIRYIDLIHKGEIDIKDNRDESLITKELMKLKFDKRIKQTKKVVRKDYESDVESDDEDVENIEMTYDYLLDMKIRSLNIKSESYKALLNKCEKLNEAIDTLKNTTLENMWLAELQEFETEYNKWVKVQEKNETEKVKNIKKTKKSGKDEAE